MSGGVVDESILCHPLVPYRWSLWSVPSNVLLYFCVEMELPCCPGWPQAVDSVMTLVWFRRTRGLSSNCFEIPPLPLSSAVPTACTCSSVAMCPTLQLSPDMLHWNQEGRNQVFFPLYQEVWLSWLVTRKRLFRWFSGVQLSCPFIRSITGPCAKCFFSYVLVSTTWSRCVITVFYSWGKQELEKLSLARSVTAGIFVATPLASNMLRRPHTGWCWQLLSPDGRVCECSPSMEWSVKNSMRNQWPGGQS